MATKIRYNGVMLQISQKTFLLAGVALLFLVSSALFAYHKRALDPNVTGDWWAIRFVSLQDEEDLRFEVENHSPITEGTYQIFADSTLQDADRFEVATNTVTTVTPTKELTTAKRIRIVVKLGDKEMSLIR